VLRSFVEHFRGDYTPAHYWGGLTPGQIVSIVAILIGLLLLWKLPRETTQPHATPKPSLAK
jgi:prolipoprotein diacylglyceryltransferase